MHDFLQSSWSRATMAHSRMRGMADCIPLANSLGCRKTLSGRLRSSDVRVDKYLRQKIEFAGRMHGPGGPRAWTDGQDGWLGGQ